MSCNFSGVLQLSGLSKDAPLKVLKLSSLPEYGVWWATAELKITELLSRIQPNGHSEVHRKVVANYVSRLVRECLNCEVFKFGSVPLKTYLPDGDIDLTAFSSHQELRDTWALDVQAVLKREEQRIDAEFSVSEVQCIHAEVKIVKCLVENIVVDISFNQLGGLCTLCFLEEVDRFIQKDHLFKRSILLVKAWCYYESRILGAHHGLISTYALETLVLYIFNVFHATLRGPLEVLFTFLDYFSNFDWEHYCVSLWGPVPLASLPNLTAESPFKNGGTLLLSKEFLDSCNALYNVFPKGQDTQARTFGTKFLNVIDPLRTNNNLGRSVSQASYHRIKSAFTLGARKLMEATEHDFTAYLEVFFSNTWERHQSSQRPDAPPILSLSQRAHGGGVPEDDQVGCGLGMPKSDVLSCKMAFKEVKSSNPYSSQVTVYRDACLHDDSPALKESCERFDGQIKHDKNDAISTQTLTLSNASKEVSLFRMRGLEDCAQQDIGTAEQNPSGLLIQKLKAYGTCIPGANQVTKGGLVAPYQLRRTVSEGGLRKAFDDTELVKRHAVQECNASHLASESSGWEAVEDNCTSMKGLQDVEGLGSRTKGDNHVTPTNEQRGTYSDLGQDESAKSKSNSNSSASTQVGTASSRMLEETTEETLAQMPPKLLFPRSQVQLYEPYNQLFQSPHASVSSLSASPLVDPLSTLKLDAGDFRDLTDAEDVPHAMPKLFTSGPVPLPVPLHGVARPLPLPNDLQEEYQKFPSWQKFEQEKLPSFGPVRWWPMVDMTINGDLPYSQEMNVDLNNIDVAFPDVITRPLAQASNNFVKRRGPSKEGITFVDPFRAEQASPGHDLFDAYHGSDGSPPPFPHLRLGGDAHAPSGRQGLLAPTTDAVHEPANHIDNAVSLRSRTRAIDHEGSASNGDTPSFIPPMYFHMVPVPVAPYHNPFYPQIPNLNQDFQFCAVNSWGSYLPYEDRSGVYVNAHSRGNLPASYLNSGPKRKITNDALSARVSSLSAEEGAVESARDLLRSDLVNHLRDLNFGRWCQEPGMSPMEAPSIYHSPNYAHNPFLWGFAPFRPNQEVAIAKPFINQVPASVKGASFGQRFNGTRNGFPGQEGTDVAELYNQKAGIRADSGNGPHRNRNSVSGRYLQVPAQVDPRPVANVAIFQQETMDTRHHSAPNLVGSTFHGGPFMGPPKLDASGSSKMEHDSVGLHLPNHRLPPVLPAAGQLEFGTLGQLEVMTSLGELQLHQDVGPIQFNRSGNGDTSSSFLSLSDTELTHTMRGKGG